MLRVVRVIGFDTKDIAKAMCERSEAKKCSSSKTSNSWDGECYGPCHLRAP